MLTLWYAKQTCAMAAHLTLALAGAEEGRDYRAERVDFASGQQRSPEFLALNPKGRVPALVGERGVLTETPAILLLLAQTFPHAGLAPLDNPWALAQAQSFNCYLCSTVHVSHAHRPRASRWADDEAAQASMRAKVPQNMAEAFELIEQHLLQGPWVLGERLSICDPYLFTITGWLKGDGVDVARFPRVADHQARFAALPAVQAVLALHR